MRKLIFSINLTLDGCCDHTKGIPDDESHDYYTEKLLDVDTFIYGRKTYQLMVPFWPDVVKNNSGPSKAINDFAHAFCSVKKMVVFSRSLERVEEKNAIVIHDNLREEVLKLKQQEGKNILTGGVDIPSQLIQLDLIDEYHIVLQPLLVGQGRRLLENFTLKQTLQLTDTKIFKSGSVAMHYAKKVN
jgi:dihydrofolate reductase